jgi:hypothetical protein
VPAIALVGCFPSRLSEHTGEPILTQIARERPEVDTSNACVLADFGTSEQAAAFRIVQVDGQTAWPQVLPMPDSPAERGLAFTLSRRGDALVVHLDQLAGGCASAASDYGTVLAILYCPTQSVALRITARDARQNALVSIAADLAPGRGLVSMELGGTFPGEQALRTVCFELADDRETDLFLRAMVLADRASWAVGGPDTGGFRVCRRAGRVFVGLPDGQQLILAHGIVWRWYPAEGINAASATGLGPVFVSPQDGSPLDAADCLGWQVAIAEASSFRCVVEAACDSQELAPADETSGPGAFARRQFTIYPDGRVYIAYAPGGPNASAPAALLALALDAQAGFENSPPAPVMATYEPAEYIHVHAQTAPGGSLLWVPAEPKAAARAVWTPTADGKRCVAAMPLDARALPIASLLWFLPLDVIAAAEIEQRAADYQRPATLRVSVGRRVFDAPGDLNHDGFNESEGCYELALESDRLHFVFEPGGQTRYAPVFRAEGTQGKKTRVYVNGRTIKDQTRDREGRLLFSLSDSLQTIRYVDVYASP